MKVSASNLENWKVSAKQGVRGTRNSVPSFGKTPNDVLYKAVKESTGPFARWLEFIGKNDGEILNTIVTGVGTAFVAPIFIAFNPFSKEDKETKVYSAWRQPISAVLAALMQIVTNVKYNQHLDKWASLGKFDRADLSAFPHAAYLRRLVKLEHPEFNKEQISKEVEKRQYRAKDEALRIARERDKNRVFQSSELVDNVAIEQAKADVKETYKKQLKSMSDKEKNKFIERKAYELAPSIAEKQVQESAKIKFDIRELVKKQLAEEGLKVTDPGVKVKGGALIPKIKFADFVEKQAKHLEELEKAGKTEEARFFKRVLEKLEGYKAFENIKELGGSMEEVVQNIKIKKAIQATIDNAQAVLKGYKRWTGIVISLITLPISCGLLNYVYPRIMEKIMPNASKKKKANQAALEQEALAQAAAKNPTQQPNKGKEVSK